MERKAMMKKIRKMGKARGLLEGVLIQLKAGNVRVHPLEYELEDLLKKLDKFFVNFTESFEE